MNKARRLNIPQRLSRIALAGSLMFAGAGVAWASCGGTEAIVTASAASLATMIVGSIGTATTTLITVDEQGTEQIIGALKVLTKQTQVSAENADNSNLQAEQAGAAFSVDLATKEVVDKIVTDFQSQGYNPCAQLTATKQMATAEAAVAASMPQRIATEIQAGGGKYASLADILKQREQQHKALFCTQAEVDAGQCTSVGAVPGGDANASLIFSGDTSPNMVAAKNAVINNIIGVPDQPLPPGSANTAQGQAYILAKKQKDAFLAFPAYSLKSIQSDSEGFDAFMNERIGQYFGTDRAAQWAQDQASEAERGVVVDMVKIQGLNLKLHERRLRQALREEANESAQLALDNQVLNGGKTQAAEAMALAANARAKVTQ